MYLINFLFIEDTDNCEEAERSHDWLKNNFEPWEEVLYHWEKSFLLRKKLIHDHTTYPNLCSLFDNWNILTSSQGYILVNNLRNICICIQSDSQEPTEENEIKLKRKVIYHFAKFAIVIENLLKCLSKYIWRVI